MKNGKRNGLLLGLALALLCAAPYGSAQRRGDKSASGMAEDKGRYRVVVGGQAAGVEEFQISRAGTDWVARGSVEIPAPGGNSKLTSRLRLTGDGAPMNYEFEWAPQGGKKISAAIAFDGGLVRMEARSEGTQPFSQEFKFETPLVVVLDNNLYHQYNILARVYDWEKKGAQVFPVLIPQDQTPGTISVEWVGAQAVDGKKLDSLRVRTADLEIELYVDASRKVQRIAVPAANAEVVRE